MTPEDLRSHPEQSPEERAEKIRKVIFHDGYEAGAEGPELAKRIDEFIAAEIRAAVEEAFEARGYAFQDAIQKCLKEKQDAKAEAYADAAKIAFAWCHCSQATHQTGGNIDDCIAVKAIRAVHDAGFTEAVEKAARLFESDANSSDSDLEAHEGFENAKRILIPARNHKACHDECWHRTGQGQ